MLLKPYVKIHSKIVGVTGVCPQQQVPRQQIIAQLIEPGQRLTPVPEQHRVALYFDREGQIYHLGYVKDSVERDVVRQLTRGNAVSVEVTEVTGGTPGRPTRGVNIEIRWRRIPESPFTRPTP
jgi:hypothetical protein